ncbi:hypothetical protein HHK36_030606 [Tetracentron sinense]|uniref:Shikimate kinase n=1 Tax=Tetracentron sinense TaxID=13715 RepID=A0A835CYV0_TETSI|nr:hypothetical protein HHK36_030606 [Tetracentron sinense]
MILVFISLSCRTALALESENFHDSFDEALFLKVEDDVLDDQFLGMMGSGKTTVGKILSEVLGYSFFDSDKLVVEQAVGGTSVSQIFKQYSESFFRDNESEVLWKLSLMRQLASCCHWKFMKQGVTVWLDVPLEALARRIAAVGTDSRPLLHQESGDAYTKAFMQLSMLSKERDEAYANADARVSLERIAVKLDQGDVSDLSPRAIVIEVFPPYPSCLSVIVVFLRIFWLGQPEFEYEMYKANLLLTSLDLCSYTLAGDGCSGDVDLDYAIRFDKLIELIAKASTEDLEVNHTELEKWERSNRMNFIIIKYSIADVIRGVIPDSDNGKKYMTTIQEQF